MRGVLSLLAFRENRVAVHARDGRFHGDSDAAQRAAGGAALLGVATGARILAENHVDVLLTRVVVPGMDGIALAKNLHATAGTFADP